MYLNSVGNFIRGRMTMEMSSYIKNGNVPGPSALAAQVCFSHSPHSRQCRVSLLGWLGRFGREMWMMLQDRRSCCTNWPELRRRRTGEALIWKISPRNPPCLTQRHQSRVWAAPSMDAWVSGEHVLPPSPWTTEDSKALIPTLHPLFLKRSTTWGFSPVLPS